MTASQEDNWTPSRELLAAYADGELDLSPHLAACRRHIEAWLARQPQAAAELEAQRELSRLWLATAPVEPAAATWAKVWARVEQTPRRLKSRRWPAAVWLLGFAAIGAAAAMLLIVLLLSTPGEPGTHKLQASLPSLRRSAVEDSSLQRAGAQIQLRAPGGHDRLAATVRRPGEVPEVFEVATSDEVEILRIAGADTDTLIVGRLPLVGPLILLTKQEVEVQPPVNDNTRTEVRMVGLSPMVWTPLPDENDES